MFYNFIDDKKEKVMKVVILGDSIRLAYGPRVEALLRKDGYDVFQPQDNCRFAKYTLRLLFDLKEQLKDADVIYFNIGHWDLCNINEDEYNFSTLEEYSFNMKRVAKSLLKITPHIIFATTTPVAKEYKYNKNSDIVLYNQEATKIMNELGIKIFDLHKLIDEDVDQNIDKDMIHLSEKGTEIATKAVYEIIKKEIELMK